MKQQAKKANQSLLATNERTFLHYVAARIPETISSDHLTIIGLFGALLSFLSYWATTIWPWCLVLASIGLLLNWIGDSLDGTVARIRARERPRYGFFVDHSADLIAQILIGVGFGLSPYLQLSSALLLLSAYLGFAAHTFIRMNVFNELQIAYFSVGPTEIRLLMVVANFIFLFVPGVSSRIGHTACTITDFVCISLAILSYGALVLQIYLDWRRLHRDKGAI